MRNGRAIGKQRCVQKSGQWRAEEELRSFPLCRGTQLFAHCESCGHETDLLEDADGFRHEHPLRKAWLCPRQGPHPPHGDHGAM